jgi:hypothetical protein
MGRGLCRLVVLVVLAACAQQEPPMAPNMPSPAPISGPVAAGMAPMGGLAETDSRTMSDGDAPSPLALVRTADVSITVDTYDDARTGLSAWLEERGGFVADEQVWRTDGRATSASLRVRIPAEQLDAMLGWIDDEVVVDRMDVRSADVTAEWVDLEARIRAHQAAEERLLGLLADRTATLADVLAAEAQLTRIRSEIEALRGRHRVLADQVTLATAQISVHVRSPAAISGVEPIKTEIGRAFRGSVGAMGRVARGSLIVAAAALPWVGVIAAVAGALFAGLVGFVGFAGIALRRAWR